MNTCKAIYWHQGLFLKPHHFQYLYAQQENENFQLREGMQAFFWGISKLQINKKELLNKNIVIEELEIIFRDGAVVKVGDNAVVANRIFDKQYDVLNEDLKIYIGLKSFNKKTVNVTELDSFENLQNVDTRFICNTKAGSVNNLYQEDESAQIQFMDYCLKIFFEDEIQNLNSYQILPLATIKGENEDILINEKYIAPLLDIKTDSHLLENIKTIQQDLTSHVMQLQEYKLPSNIILQEVNYLKYVMALQALSPYAIKLNHMLKISVPHPLDYYELFLELIGILSTFSNRVNIFGKLENGTMLIGDYDHLNLYECFNNVKVLIKELLDVIIIGPDYILPFTKKDTSFTLECPISIFHANYRYFLVVKAPTDKEKITKLFLEFVKIAASSEIETIVQRSLLGLQFETYDMPIQGLPQREESMTYELITDDEQWGHIQQKQNITINFDEALDDISIELIVIKN